MSSNTLISLVGLGIGGYLVYRWLQQRQGAAGTLPAQVNSGLSNPSAARASAFDASTFTATNYPGVAANPSSPGISLSASPQDSSSTFDTTSYPGVAANTDTSSGSGMTGLSWLS